MKACRRCQQVKPPAEFRMEARNADGLTSWCRECHRERSSSWAKESRERLSQKAAERRSADREGARKANRKFKARHRDRLATIHADWAKRNADKRRATTAKRKAAKLTATPAWADSKLIAAIYAEATSTDGRWHVDHIVPLQGETVCGLHCEANLQVLPAAENEGKRNRWWPDMFEDAQRQGDFFGEAAA